MTADAMEPPRKKQKWSADHRHPYLSGNFFPVSVEHDLTACEYEGVIPRELSGGQYLRNGGNPQFAPSAGSAYHWFDGEGMIHGVYFSHSANTAVHFHDRRLLATCESGPPVYLTAPELETVGFHVFPDGVTGKGGLGRGKLTVGSEDAYGALPVAARMLEEWTTAHPKKDPVTGDLIFMGYNIFQRPFVTYSVVAADGRHRVFKQPVHIPSPKMIHDIPVSLQHTVILDLPLCMDPLAPFKPGGKHPMVHFDRKMKSRFGILPRLYSGQRDHVRWFEAPPCLIFHAANTWDETLQEAHLRLGNQNRLDSGAQVAAVCLLACRFLSAKLIHAAAGRRAPEAEEQVAASTIDGDTVKLTYMRFSMHESDPLRPSSEGSLSNAITHQFALSAIPFEFPVVPFQRSMQESRFAFGLSLSGGSFSEALEGAKPDVIVRIDVRELITRGHALWDEGLLAKDGSAIVDTRTVKDVVADRTTNHSSICCFALPVGCYASEPAFIPKEGVDDPDGSNGYLVFYVFDESQLDTSGEAPETATSELWVLDAQDMRTIVAKITLPARVPYGLHSAWICEEEMQSQRHLGNEKTLLSKRMRMHEMEAEKRAASAKKLAVAFSYIDAYTIIMFCGLMAQVVFALILANRGGIKRASTGVEHLEL